MQATDMLFSLGGSRLFNVYLYCTSLNSACYINIIIIKYM